jgi:trans-2,3-dihydro-3-hydroxyanthranilate isomerase
VRIFTPASEIPFAGHPTLGTAFVIQKEILKEVTREVVLNFKAGRISVSFAFGGEDADILWMKQLEPVFGKTFDPAEVAPLLNLDPGLIDTRFPVQEVSTGLFALIVPLKTLAAVKHSRTNREKLLDFISRSEARTVLLFSSQTYSPQNDLNVRVYADYLGVPEDPATGSANGCLAGYLVKHRYYGGDRINVRVEQGYEIGRPSLILLRAELSGGQIAVHVGGKVILVARGKLV